MPNVPQVSASVIENVLFGCIAPIHGTMDAVRDALGKMKRVTVISQKEDYLYAEFRTPLMRYVDDVEFFFDGTVIHVRSCSRLGRRDFGVNRKRVEQLRSLIEARSKAD